MISPMKLDRVTPPAEAYYRIASRHPGPRHLDWYGGDVWETRVTVEGDAADSLPALDRGVFYTTETEARLCAASVLDRVEKLATETGGIVRRTDTRVSCAVPGRGADRVLWSITAEAARAR